MRKTVQFECIHSKSMFEGVVAGLLSDYLHEYLYVEGLSKEDIKVSIWSGKVVLENLSLRSDACAAFLGDSVSVKRGTLKRVEVSIPWSSLRSKPVVITIADADLIVSGRREDFAKRSPKEYLSNLVRKQRKIVKLDEEASRKWQAKESAKNSSSFVRKLAGKIIDNLQLQFERFSLSVEDESFGSIGFSFDALKIVSTDENGQVVFVSDCERIHKLLSVEGLAISVLPKTTQNAEESGTIMHIDAVAVRMDAPKPSSDKDAKGFEVVAKLTCMELSVSNAQYRALMTLLAFLENRTSLQGRPQRRPDAAPREWWRYGGLRLIANAKHRAGLEASKRFVALHRRRYIDLFKKRLYITKDTMPDLDASERCALVDLEETDAFTYAEILSLRKAARQEVREQVPKGDIYSLRKGEFDSFSAVRSVFSTDSKKNKRKAARKVSASATAEKKSSGWSLSSWWRGTASSDDNKVAKESESSVESSWTPEMQSELYNAIGYSDGEDAGASEDMSRFHISFAARLEADVVSLSLSEESENGYTEPLARFTLGGANFSATKSATCFKLSASLRDMSLANNSSGVSPCLKQVLWCGQCDASREENILSIDYSKSDSGSSVVMRWTRSVHFFGDVALLNRIMEAYATPRALSFGHIEQAAMATLLHRTSKVASLQDVVGIMEASRFDVDISVVAPTIYAGPSSSRACTAVREHAIRIALGTIHAKSLPQGSNRTKDGYRGISLQLENVSADLLCISDESAVSFEGAYSKTSASFLRDFEGSADVFIAGPQASIEEASLMVSLNIPKVYIATSPSTLSTLSSLLSTVAKDASSETSRRRDAYTKLSMMTSKDLAMLISAVDNSLAREKGKRLLSEQAFRYEGASALVNRPKLSMEATLQILKLGIYADSPNGEPQHEINANAHNLRVSFASKSASSAIEFSMQALKIRHDPGDANPTDVVIFESDNGTAIKADLDLQKSTGSVACSVVPGSSPCYLVPTVPFLKFANNLARQLRRPKREPKVGGHSYDFHSILEGYCKDKQLVVPGESFYKYFSGKEQHVMFWLQRLYGKCEDLDRFIYAPASDVRGSNERGVQKINVERFELKVSFQGASPGDMWTTSFKRIEIQNNASELCMSIRNLQLADPNIIMFDISDAEKQSNISFSLSRKMREIVISTTGAKLVYATPAVERIVSTLETVLAEQPEQVVDNADDASTDAKYKITASLKDSVITVYTCLEKRRCFQCTMGMKVVMHLGSITADLESVKLISIGTFQKYGFGPCNGSLEAFIKGVTVIFGKNGDGSKKMVVHVGKSNVSGILDAFRQSIPTVLSTISSADKLVSTLVRIVSSSTKQTESKIPSTLNMTVILEPVEASLLDATIAQGRKDVVRITTSESISIKASKRTESEAYQNLDCTVAFETISAATFRESSGTWEPFAHCDELNVSYKTTKNLKDASSSSRSLNVIASHIFEVNVRPAAVSAIMKSIAKKRVQDDTSYDSPDALAHTFSRTILSIQNKCGNGITVYADADFPKDGIKVADKSDSCLVLQEKSASKSERG